MPNDRSWQLAPHVLQRRGLVWPVGFFTGQAGCFCCSDTYAYHVGGYIAISPFVTTANQRYSKSGDSWSVKSALPSARALLGAASCGGKGYAVFGQNSAFGYTGTCYEYVEDSWSTKTSGPSPTRHSVGAAGNTTDLYAFGSAYSGPNVGRDNDAYNQSGDSWTSKTDLPTPARSSACAVLLGGYFYAVAGVDSGGGRLRDIDRYDSAGDSWASKTDCPTPARYVSNGGGTLGSYLYITGGDDGGYIADHDQYSEDSWASMTSIATARTVSGAAELSGAYFVMCGFNGTYLTTTEDYVVDTWSSKSGITTSTPSGGAFSI